jgi:SAM-dependent methyltransferase
MPDGALPQEAFKAYIEMENGPAALFVGQTIYQTVRLKNISSHVWPVLSRHPVTLSYHWLTQSQEIIRDGLRTPLPCSLEPGQEIVLDCMIQAPETAGAYQLELDLVQEGISWFRDRGSATRRLSCQVTPAPPRHRLVFTGRCSEAEFQAACTQQDWWYHSYYFDNGFAIPGDYDIGRNIHEYDLPDDMKGMSVLDIGTGGGWFAVYFAQRGAEVTAVDVRGTCDYDVRGGREGRHLYPPVESEKAVPDRIDADGTPIYFSRVSRSLWIMKELLSLPIRYVNARIYDIRPELFRGRTFDLVFVGALLLHLRDPIGALMAARTVCRQRLIATSPTVQDDHGSEPWMKMVPAADGAWWLPNKACYHRWFLEAGFRQVNVDRRVTLTGEQPLPSFDNPTPGAIRNGTQCLQLADARL